MAAYGALVSVMQIMDQLYRHPHPPISLHKEQAESLAANVTFLQQFLEGYNPRVSYTSEADPLESRIAEAAYAAEDLIESYIVDQIRARLTDHDGAGKISSTEFYQGLEKVIQEMDLIKLEVMGKKMQGVQIIKKQSTAEAASSRSSSSTAHKETTMVGLDEVLSEMLEKIARGPRARQIIPIVGMGGLGKTTLARNIYENQLVKEHFDIRAWSTISQVHDARKILIEILSQVGLGNGGNLSEDELGVKLSQHLIGRRYLIVMDDMWCIEAWDVVSRFFPDNGNGSRVVVTTRLSKLASMFDYTESDRLDMKFLDEASSWNLFQRTVFGEGIFPPELEAVGRKIVQGCRGLPLSIVVVGGLLSKSDATQENWQVIEENLSSVVNAEDGGSCLQILYTSYNDLPVHIKPCFLYLGIFNEDHKIRVDLLIKLWVAEGFVKPIDGKSLEEAGEEYLQELFVRNLVLVERRDHCGGLESIKVHDLLRDLALKEAENQKFLYWLKQSDGDSESCGGIIRSRRCITNWPKKDYYRFHKPIEPAGASPLLRSLIGTFCTKTLSSPKFRLLRVCTVKEDGCCVYRGDFLIRLLNLRFLHVVFFAYPFPNIPSSYLWNLQTLYINKGEDVGDYMLEIWKMTQLRHVVTNEAVALYLPDPPPLGSGDERDEVVVLENLHTLSIVRNLKLSEDRVVTRIPNIRTLYLHYSYDSYIPYDSYISFGSYEVEEDKKKGDYYCLNNLRLLNKLEELHLAWWDYPPVQDLSLPDSLVQLTLEGRKFLPWEEMASKIGCLPHLQVLKLEYRAVFGSEWETVEGQFSSLIYLKIQYCDDLEKWVTEDSTHFPRLEHLVLSNLGKLREIPSCIGDITTLRSIELVCCSDSAAESARRIQEEQEEYGNEVLQIQIRS